jgi:hypothetical protein
MESSDITPQNYSKELSSFELSVLRFLAEQGLPTEAVLVPVNERLTIFRNLVDVLSRINDQQKPHSI